MVNLYSKFFFLVAVARINSITLEFTFMSRKWPNVQNTRSMELSLRSFASMRAVRLFCEHWHWVKKFVLRAACTSENTAWQAVCTPAYFFPSHLSFTKRKRCFESSDLADNSRTDIDNMVQPITSAYSQLWLVWCSFTWVRDGRSIDHTTRRNFKPPDSWVRACEHSSNFLRAIPAKAKFCEHF